MEILIHIGYPKTGTTSFQNGLLKTLHYEGKINYLGIGTNPEDPSFGEIAANLRNHMFFGGNDFFKLPLSNNKLNVISDEHYTMPGLHLEKKFGKALNPFDFASKLRYIINENGVNTAKILIATRNQSDLIESLYVQQYRLFDSNNDFNTFEKYFHNYIKKNNNDVFRFKTLQHEYEKEFGAENVFTYSFHDFCSRSSGFIKTISQLLHSDESLIIKNLYNQKFRVKNITNNKAEIVDRKKSTFVVFASKELKRYHHLYNFLFKFIIRTKAFKFIYRNLLTKEVNYKISLRNEQIKKDIQNYYNK